MDATKVFDDLTWANVVIEQEEQRVLSQGAETQGSPCSLQLTEDQGG